MTSLVLSREPRFAELARWLGPHAAGTVVVTTRGPDAGLPPAGTFRWVEQVPDYRSPAVGARIVALAGEFGVTRIGSLNESDVLRAAAAREVLGLPGQCLPSAVAFRDKHVMKSLAAAAGVAVPPMRRAGSREQAEAAAREIGYPVVVKPVDGGASVGVRRLAGPADWAEVPGQAEYLVESWVDEAAFYIVDGLMRDGEIVRCLPLRMLSGNLTFVSSGEPVAGWSLAADSAECAEVTAFTARALRALPPVPHETAFHLELFRVRDGGLLLCEVAARPGGMGHAPNFAEATGVDLNAASLLGQLGLGRTEPRSPRLREAGFAYFPRRAGRLVRHPEAMGHPHVTSYVAVAAAGADVEVARWVGDSVARIRLAAPLGADIGALTAEVIKEYEAGTEWAPSPRSG